MTRWPFGQRAKPASPFPCHMGGDVRGRLALRKQAYRATVCSPWGYLIFFFDAGNEVRIVSAARRA